MTQNSPFLSYDGVFITRWMTFHILMTLELPSWLLYFQVTLELLQDSWTSPSDSLVYMRLFIFHMWLLDFLTHVQLIHFSHKEDLVRGISSYLVQNPCLRWWGHHITINKSWSASTISQAPKPWNGKWLRSLGSTKLINVKPISSCMLMEKKLIEW